MTPLTYHVELEGCTPFRVTVCPRPGDDIDYLVREAVIEHIGHSSLPDDYEFWLLKEKEAA